MGAVISGVQWADTRNDQPKRVSEWLPRETEQASGSGWVEYSNNKNTNGQTSGNGWVEYKNNNTDEQPSGSGWNERNVEIIQGPQGMPPLELPATGENTKGVKF